ncbi:MAG: thermonuclease family protein [Oscillospiraceae bacterium]|nr:thermonuclease family protein [Oscillospiraceae bacterium]MCL2277918.1 thermonuclease family protein [Oscillospiraceae bacterium]
MTFRFNSSRKGKRRGGVKTRNTPFSLFFRIALLLFVAVAIFVFIVNGGSIDGSDKYNIAVSYPVYTNNFNVMERAFVKRVIDGDTIKLYSGESVRLIGINTPETGEPGADEAAEFVSDAILGRGVWLERDGRNTDRFGRLRRYVWLVNAMDTQDEYLITNYQLNALLLINGHAEVLIVDAIRNEALFRELTKGVH